MSHPRPRIQVDTHHFRLLESQQALRRIFLSSDPCKKEFFPFPDLTDHLRRWKGPTRSVGSSPFMPDYDLERSEVF